MKHVNTSNTVMLLGAAALLAPVGAEAKIVGVSGQTQQIAPPSFVIQGAYYTGSPDTTVVWDELQGVPASGVPADMVNNPASDLTALAGSVSGLVDSHYIYFRHWGGPSIGSVTFSGPIVGVEFLAAGLGATDAQFAPVGTAYLSGSGGMRGTMPGADAFSISGNTLSFDLLGMFFDTAEIRVLTAVPAPGAGALAGLGLVTAARRARRGRGA